MERRDFDVTGLQSKLLLFDCRLAKGRSYMTLPRSTTSPSSIISAA